MNSTEHTEAHNTGLYLLLLVFQHHLELQYSQHVQMLLTIHHKCITCPNLISYPSQKKLILCHNRWMHGTEVSLSISTVLEQGILHELNISEVLSSTKTYPQLFNLLSVESRQRQYNTICLNYSDQWSVVMSRQHLMHATTFWYGIYLPMWLWPQ